MDKQREARQAAATFQTKVVKSMENMLASPRKRRPDSRQARDLYGVSRRLRRPDQNAQRAARSRGTRQVERGAAGASSPASKTPKSPRSLRCWTHLQRPIPSRLPFALTLVASRLKTHWQLIRLATKAARTKNAADVAGAPYAAAVPWCSTAWKTSARHAAHRAQAGAHSRRQGNSGRHLRHRISRCGSASISSPNPIGDDGSMR